MLYAPLYINIHWIVEYGYNNILRLVFVVLINKQHKWIDDFKIEGEDMAGTWVGRQ